MVLLARTTLPEAAFSEASVSQQDGHKADEQDEEDDEDDEQYFPGTASLVLLLVCDIEVRVLRTWQLWAHCRCHMQERKREAVNLGCLSL